MRINNAQLVVWARAPGTTSIQSTHLRVRKAIEQNPLFAGKDIDIYLQGSYANSTNIRTDGDVDVVVQLNSTFSHNASVLPTEQQKAFHQHYPTAATYTFAQFRQDLFVALSGEFGQGSIKYGNKSIKFLGAPGFLKADIIPCLHHHEYSFFVTPPASSRVDGVKLYGFDGSEVVNFPKLHIENGEKKNGAQRTKGMFKDTVRIVKNLRRRIEEEQSFDCSKAPSYFVESAIYNVPDDRFTGGNHRQTFEAVFDYLWLEAQVGSLMTPSHQHLLFGPNAWQWNMEDAKHFMSSVRGYYSANRVDD